MSWKWSKRRERERESVCERWKEREKIDNEGKRNNDSMVYG